MFWQLWVVSGELLLHVRLETWVIADRRPQVSFWASVLTSLSKTPVASLGVSNSVQHLFRPLSSDAASGSVPSHLVGS